MPRSNHDCAALVSCLAHPANNAGSLRGNIALAEFVCVFVMGAQLDMKSLVVVPVADNITGILVAAAQQHIGNAPAFAQNNIGLFPGA